MHNGADDDDRLYGGSGEDLLDGGEGRDRLDGGKDSDTILFRGARALATGGDDADTFQFITGLGIVRDFEQGADIVNLSTHDDVGDFDEVLALATEVNGNTRIELDDGTLVLRNLALADLAATDFSFDDLIV